MTIFLTGYMACGKTTLGRAIARETGMQFIDLDFYIEQRFRKKITEIFAQSGEEEFRRMESAMLREVGEFDDTVIACGGGTPCFGDNMDYMNTHGETIYLEAPVDVIVRRILQAGPKRPIAASHTPEELPAFVESHLQQRLKWYNQARHRLNAADLESRPAIAAAVRRLLTILNHTPTPHNSPDTK